jgi:hypothetical protein
MISKKMWGRRNVTLVFLRTRLHTVVAEYDSSTKPFL